MAHLTQGEHPVREAEGRESAPKSGPRRAAGLCLGTERGGCCDSGVAQAFRRWDSDHPASRELARAEAGEEGCATTPKSTRGSAAFTQNRPAISFISRREIRSPAATPSASLRAPLTIQATTAPAFPPSTMGIPISRVRSPTVKAIRPSPTPFDRQGESPVTAASGSRWPLLCPPCWASAPTPRSSAFPAPAERPEGGSHVLPEGVHQRGPWPGCLAGSEPLAPRGCATPARSTASRPRATRG